MMHLMWSRYGVQELVGNRGSLFSALTMNETANFSSNSDHRGLISKKVNWNFKVY